MIDGDRVVRRPSDEEIDRRLEILLRAHCAEKHIDRDKIDAVEYARFCELEVVQELLALKYPQRRA